MNNMNIIITMGGLGIRFRKAGYKEPKYMIEARGKTLFEWSMDSLLDYNNHVNKYIFVVRKEDNAKEFILEKCKNIKFCDIEVLELDYLTDGQATTAMLAMPYCAENEAILIYNIDTYVEPYEMKFDAICGDGHIPCFNAEGDHWSFVKLDADNKVIEVKEKVRVSNNCTLGAYYFASAKIYQLLYEEYYCKEKNSSIQEKYIAPLYNYMLEKNMNVTISLIDSKKVHVLGTPEELEIFIK